MRKAVIGIGSNSVRMLLCEVVGGCAVRRLRDRAGTRLFAGLDERRCLAEDSMRTTAAAVRRMAETARLMEAAEIRLFATSATRDAVNAGDFAALLKAETGLDLEVIPGEEEAALSYLGASGGGQAGVIDIGGGSTEIVVGCDAEIRSAVSCQIGAVRLSRMLPIRTADEVEQGVRAAAEIIRPELARCGTAELPADWVGTGGTFTCLASLVNGTAWEDRSRTQGTRVERGAAEAIACELAVLPMEERLRMPSLQPGRADIAVHGICILLACMDLLGIPAIRVSEYGNLDGYFRKRFGLVLI